MEFERSPFADPLREYFGTWDAQCASLGRGTPGQILDNFSRLFDASLNAEGGKCPAQMQISVCMPLKDLVHLIYLDVIHRPYSGKARSDESIKLLEKILKANPPASIVEQIYSIATRQSPHSLDSRMSKHLILLLIVENGADGIKEKAKLFEAERLSGLLDNATKALDSGENLYWLGDGYLKEMVCISENFNFAINENHIPQFRKFFSSLNTRKFFELGYEPDIVLVQRIREAVKNGHPDLIDPEFMVRPVAIRDSSALTLKKTR